MTREHFKQHMVELKRTLIISGFLGVPLSTLLHALTTRNENINDVAAHALSILIIAVLFFTYVYWAFYFCTKPEIVEEYEDKITPEN